MIYRFKLFMEVEIIAARTGKEKEAGMRLLRR